jgi:uncharacterized protein (DUF2237 family)
MSVSSVSLMVVTPRLRQANADAGQAFTSSLTSWAVDFFRRPAVRHLASRLPPASNCLVVIPVSFFDHLSLVSLEPPTMPLDQMGSFRQPDRQPSHNVLGGTLQTCSGEPLTGFFRDGCCNTGSQDRGSHTVCAIVTADFLRFSQNQGNDLSTPLPEYGFPGLKPGDQWCLCAPRWQ